jgi:hypothetical protein
LHEPQPAIKKNGTPIAKLSKSIEMALAQLCSECSLKIVSVRSLQALRGAPDSSLSPGQSGLYVKPHGRCRVFWRYGFRHKLLHFCGNARIRDSLILPEIHLNMRSL